MSAIQKNIGIIGFGKMAEVIFSRAVATGTVNPTHVLVLSHRQERDRSLKKKYGFAFVKSAADLCLSCPVIFLAIKPQQMQPVMAQLKPHLADHLILTVAAGLEVRTYRKALGQKTRIIRVMPNTPALVGSGVFTVYRGPGVSGDDLKLCQKLIQSCGMSFVIKNETHMHALTALTASSPAFVTLFVFALIESALELGVPQKLAKTLALKSMAGTLDLIWKSGLSAKELISEVASKKGMTEAGLKWLAKKRFTGIIGECMQKTVKQSHELGRMQT